MAETVQWEYRIETIGKALSGPKDEEATAYLNGWGEVGWEVIGIFPIESSNKVRVVAKRQLTASTRRQRSTPVM